MRSVLSVNVQIRGIRRAARHLTRTQRDLEGGARSANHMTRALGVLGRMRARPRVTIDTKAAHAKLGALSARLRAFARERWRAVVDVDTSRGIRGLLRFNGSLDQTRVNLGLFTASLRTLPAIMATTLPLLAAMGAGLGALVSSLGAGVLGFGALGVAALGLLAPFGALAAGVVVHMSRMADAQKGVEQAQERLRNAVATGTEASIADARKRLAMAQAELDQYRKLSDAVKQLQADAETAIGGGVTRVIEGLVTAMGNVGPAIRSLRGAFTNLGAAVGDSFVRVSEVFSSDRWVEFFGMLTNSAARATGPMTGLFLEVSRIMRDITWAAMPALLEALDDLRDKLAGVGGGSIEKLRKTIDGLVEQTRQWFSLIGNVGGGLFNIFKAANPQAKSFVGWLDEGAEKWRDWTGSAKGQETIRAFFDAVLPVMRRLLPILGQLAVMMLLFAQVTAPAAEIFLEGFGLILGVVNDVLQAITKLPEPVQTVIGAFLILSGPIKIVTALITGLKLAAGALSVALRGLMFNPIGLAITAVIAAGYLLVTQWEHIKGVLLAVWDAIKTAGAAVFGFLKGLIVGAWEAVKSVTLAVWGKIKEVTLAVWGFIGPYLTGLWDGLVSVVTTVFGAIASVVSGVWNVIATVTEAVWGIIRGVLEIVWALLKAGAKLWFGQILNIVKAVWDAISTATKAVWNFIKPFLERLWRGIKRIAEFLWDVISTVIIDPILWVRDRLADAWEWIKEKAKAVWESIKTAAEFYWGLIKDNIIDPVRDAANWVWDKIKWLAGKVEDGFNTIVGGAVDFASDLIGKITGAFRSVVNTIGGFINKVIGIVNKIPGVDIKYRYTPLNAPTQMGAQERRQRNTGAGGLARGGIVDRPQVLVGEQGPRHPEFVIPTNPNYRKRAMGLTGQLLGKLGMDQGRLAAYAKGGTIGRKPQTGGVGDVMKDVAGLPMKALSQGAKWFLDKLPGFGNFPGWIKGLGKHAISKVGAWIKEKVGALLPGGGAAGGGDPGSLGMITALAKRFGLMVTSGFRPGDPGWHGKNRARDYSNGFGPTGEMMSFAQFMLKSFGGRLLELIYTPLGRAIKNGAVVPPYAQADHYDHVHVAMAQGGIIGRTAKAMQAPSFGPAGLAPFVGSYRGGGIVPQDGLAYVHQGERVVPEGRSHGDGPLVVQNIERYIVGGDEQNDDKHARRTEFRLRRMGVID